MKLSQGGGGGFWNVYYNSVDWTTERERERVTKALRSLTEARTWMATRYIHIASASATIITHKDSSPQSSRPSSTISLCIKVKSLKLFLSTFFAQQCILRRLLQKLLDFLSLAQRHFVPHWLSKYIGWKINLFTLIFLFFVNFKLIYCVIWGW